MNFFLTTFTCKDIHRSQRPEPLLLEGGIAAKNFQYCGGAEGNIQKYHLKRKKPNAVGLYLCFVSSTNVFSSSSSHCENN